MTHVTCRLTAKNRDQLRNPTLGNRVWATFNFFYNTVLWWATSPFLVHSHSGASRSSCWGRSGGLWAVHPAGVQGAESPLRVWGEVPRSCTINALSVMSKASIAPACIRHCIAVNQSINRDLFGVVQVIKSLQDPLKAQGNNLPGINENVRERGLEQKMLPDGDGRSTDK